MLVGKAKKALLLAVFILALLAVALILPAVATGKSDNKPVAWVNWGNNSNNVVLPEQFQVSIAVS